MTLFSDRSLSARKMLQQFRHRQSKLKGEGGEFFDKNSQQLGTGITALITQWFS
jgi:hypothetical protein